MVDTFERMYFLLFNSITDALRELESGNSKLAMEMLTEAQQRAEEMYIQGDETTSPQQKTGER
ncbi:MAG: hypothetical protein KH339_04160 [Firmicutes bacterium]|nr:hypothetical protein [Bacillota bacterium]